MKAHKLNAAAVDRCRELLIQGKIDDGPWLPFDNIDAAQVMGGPTGGEAGEEPDIKATYGTYFLGMKAVAEGDDVDDYVYPFGRVSWQGDMAKTSISALRLIRLQAAHLGETEIFKAANEMLSLATGNQFTDGDDDGWWVEVMKTGTWTGATGGTQTFTDGDLENIAAAFKATFPDVKPVLRLGDHPGLSAGVKPAVGWVTDMKAEGGKLLAYFSEVPTIVRDAIKGSLYRNVSAGLWKDWNFENKVYPWVMNHVAILGAELPAIKGLADLQAYMASGRSVVPESVACFTQANKGEDMDKIEELTKKVEDLESQVATLTTERDSLSETNTGLTEKVNAFNAKAMNDEVVTVADGAVKAGRLLPKDRDNAVKVGLALRAGSVNLKDGEEDPFTAWKDGLENGGKLVEMGEKSPTGDESTPNGKYDEEFNAGAAAAKAVQSR